MFVALNCAEMAGGSLEFGDQQKERKSWVTPWFEREVGGWMLHQILIKACVEAEGLFTKSPSPVNSNARWKKQKATKATRQRTAPKTLV